MYRSSCLDPDGLMWLRGVRPNRRSCAAVHSVRRLLLHVGLCWLVAGAVVAILSEDVDDHLLVDWNLILWRWFTSLIKLLLRQSSMMTEGRCPVSASALCHKLASSVHD